MSILIYADGGTIIARMLDHNMVACARADSSTQTAAALSALHHLECVYHTYRDKVKKMPGRADQRYWDMFDSGVAVTVDDLREAAHDGLSLRDIASSKVRLLLGAAA